MLARTLHARRRRVMVRFKEGEYELLRTVAHARGANLAELCRAWALAGMQGKLPAEGLLPHPADLAKELPEAVEA